MKKQESAKQTASSACVPKCPYCTQALGHLEHSDTWALRGHLKGTWALKALRRSGARALKALRHSGTWALDPL